MPFGIYTVLFHHNSWTEKDLLIFKRNIEHYRKFISDLKTVISQHSSRKKSLVDELFETFNYLMIRKGQVRELILWKLKQILQKV